MPNIKDNGHKRIKGHAFSE